MTYYFSKHYKLFTKLVLILLTLLTLGLVSVWNTAQAQTQAQLAHILTTVVQLEDVTSNRGIEQMSTGVIVHQDGYILTPDLAPSVNPEGRWFRVYVSSADNTPSKWSYIAVLDRQLPNNLQLLKIISKQDQSPLDAGQSFPVMEIAGNNIGASNLVANSGLSLWSYPAGIAKFVERASGQVTASQGAQVFSNVRLEPGNIGGVVTTSFESGALPQLSAIATGVASNQQTQLLVAGAINQDLQSYLPSYLPNQQVASRTFATPQAGAALDYQLHDYQLQSTFGYGSESQSRVPVSYANYDQVTSRNAGGFDPLAFLSENPQNQANTAANIALNSAGNAFNNNQTFGNIAPSAQPTFQNPGSFQTQPIATGVGLVPEAGGENIIITASQTATNSNTNFGQTGLVASSNYSSNQDIYSSAVNNPNLDAFKVSVPNTGQAGLLPANVATDALLSVFAGQAQSSHVSSQEVTNFMQQAARGGTVNLQAGVYYLPEGIELSNDVSLRGAGKNQTFVVAKSGYHVLKFSGHGNFSAEGISFVYDGPSDANGLHMLAGHVSLSNVRSTNTQTQVGGLLPSQQQVREGSGLLLDLYVQSARIETSEFDFNPAFGVSVRGQVKPLINQNLIHHNGLAGIRFTEQAGGQVEHNIIEENVYFGIDVSAVGRVRLERNSFRRNGSFGVNAIESAQVNFANNNFDANGQGEIRY